MKVFLRTSVFISLIIGLLACNSSTKGISEGGTNENDTLNAKNELLRLDSSLVTSYRSVGTSSQDIPRDLIQQIIEKNKAYVQKFPKDNYVPTALDKIQQLYQQLGDYRLSAEYGEIIIEQHPSYKNINRVLYEVATTYDFMLNEKSKAISLYRELLKKKNTLSPSTVDDIDFRLHEIEKGSTVH